MVLKIGAVAYIIRNLAPADGLDPAKYQQFALTDEELIFFFGQGEIMAGAGGALRATVPRSAIADMLA